MMANVTQTYGYYIRFVSDLTSDPIGDVIAVGLTWDDAFKAMRDHWRNVGSEYSWPSKLDYRYDVEFYIDDTKHKLSTKETGLGNLIEVIANIVGKDSVRIPSSSGPMRLDVSFDTWYHHIELYEYIMDGKYDGHWQQYDMPSFYDFLEQDDPVGWEQLILLTAGFEWDFEYEREDRHFYVFPDTYSEEDRWCFLYRELRIHNFHDVHSMEKMYGLLALIRKFHDIAIHKFHYREAGILESLRSNGWSEDVAIALATWYLNNSNNDRGKKGLIENLKENVERSINWADRLKTHIDNLEPLLLESVAE